MFRILPQPLPLLLYAFLGSTFSLEASLEARLANVEVAADDMFVAVNDQVDAVRRIAVLESKAKQAAESFKAMEMMADKVQTLAHELAQETELRQQQTTLLQEANEGVAKELKLLRVEFVEKVKAEVAKQLKEFVAAEVAAIADTLRSPRYGARKNSSNGSSSCNSTGGDADKYTKRLSALEIRQTLRDKENLGSNSVSILTTLGDNVFGELLNREEVLSRGRLFKLRTELGTMHLPTEQVGDAS
jgi:hypothetical protein